MGSSKEKLVTRILGIDPGKTTGWAAIKIHDDKKIEPCGCGNTKDMTLIEIVDEIRQADEIVYEGFWLRPDKAHKGAFDWQNFSAEKVIGALLTLIKLHQKKEPVKQQPSQRIPGYAFAGLTYKKGVKGRHWEDALAHAAYFAVKHLGATPVL